MTPRPDAPGPFLPTGSLRLDIVLGGGWTPGTVNEITGDPALGRALARATAARQAVPATWIVTGGETPAPASGLLTARPADAEEAFAVMTHAAAASARLVIVDHACGLIRRAELDGGYVPSEHREYARELTLLKRACRTSGTCVIFLSPPRETQRAPLRGTGIAEKAHRRVRLEAWNTRQDGVTGVTARAGGQSARFTVAPGRGLDAEDELLRAAVEYRLVTARGNWYEIDGIRLRGANVMTAYLRSAPRTAARLEEAVRARASLPDPATMG